MTALPLPQLAPAGQDMRCELVVVAVSPDLQHVGVLFVDPDDEDREVCFFHIQGHFQFTASPTDAPLRWVQPTLTLDQRLRVLSRLLTVAAFYAEGRLGYGLDPTGAVFSPSGALLHDGLGLSCASLVAVLFESAGLPLVDLQSWAVVPRQRAMADVVAKRLIIRALRNRQDAGVDWETQARAEVGRGPWLRSGEIAAASGTHPHPVGYPDADRLSAHLRRLLLPE